MRHLTLENEIDKRLIKKFAQAYFSETGTIVDKKGDTYKVINFRVLYDNGTTQVLVEKINIR